LLIPPLLKTKPGIGKIVLLPAARLNYSTLPITKAKKVPKSEAD
jgi:hypothetical protein